MKTLRLWPLLLLLLCLTGCPSNRPDDPPPPPPDPPAKTAIDSTGPLVACGSMFCRPSGEQILLAGEHWGWEIQSCGDQWEPTPGCFDFERAVDDLVRWNHNALRLWTSENTLFGVSHPGAKNPAKPMQFERTGPGTAGDGLPKFDLTKPSPAYMARVRSRVEYLRERNLYGVVMLFQGVSINPNVGPEFDAWETLLWNPRNNIQAYPLAKPGWQAHRATSGPIWEAQRRYMRAVVQALEGLPNVLLEVANEDKHGSIEWQTAVVSELRTIMDEELPHTPWLIGATFRQGDGTNAELVATGADWISPKAGRPVSLFRNWRPIGGVPNLLDDDHFWIQHGAGTTRPEMPRLAIEQGAAGFLHLGPPERYLGRNSPSDPERHDRHMAIRKAMGQIIE